MAILNSDGSIACLPHGFLVSQGPQFCLILVTHNKSTFYANNRWKAQWTNLNVGAQLEKKGKG
jgi:hypothetical protein